MTLDENAELGADEPPRLNLDEWERAARKRLPHDVYEYYAGGAEDEVTLRANRDAYRSLYFRPRRLVDVSRIDVSTSVLGSELSTPVLIAPTALQRLAHPDGELAMARAAAAAGTVMIASTVSTYPIEEICSAADGDIWLQLYVFPDRAVTESLVQRAEEAGCTALCLTIDVPVQGNRERNIRNRFQLPHGIEIANFHGSRAAHFPAGEGSGLAGFIREQFDPSLDWSAIEWLASRTRLPIVVKGVLTAEDTRLAIDAGVSGIIVSNHGGRQLDGALPTLYALPEVVDAAGDRCPVLLDGGVRRGADVVKALSLGARAVLVGRPPLWGLSVDGETGVRSILSRMSDEIERCMALLGRTSIDRLDRTAVQATPASFPL